MKSLRARLIVAALLWTFGLAVVYNAAVLHLLRHYPGRVVHYIAMATFALGLRAWPCSPSCGPA
jgi:hypothetical protein